MIRAGGRVGIVSLSWPFVGVTISEDRLDVSQRLVAGINPFTLRRESVSTTR